ncbi:hypothetical protein VIGAN_02228500, partial [Vigna angularis var. angularis]
RSSRDARPGSLVQGHNNVLHLKQTELNAFLEGLYPTPTNRINTSSIPVIPPNPIEDNKIKDILRKLVNSSCQRYLSQHCNSSIAPS